VIVPNSYLWTLYETDFPERSHMKAPRVSDFPYGAFAHYIYCIGRVILKQLFPSLKSLHLREGAMVKGKWIAVFVLLLIAVQPSFADDRDKLLGIWKLVSWESEFQATGERGPIMGKNPTGYIIFTPEGQMMAVLTAEGRKPPSTDQDRADLMKSVVAYSGIYRIEGDKWITNVDVAWNPAWLGTEQVRFFKFEGNRLHIISTWVESVRQPEKGKSRAIITYERMK
jgi:hypothetical protein